MFEVFKGTKVDSLSSEFFSVYENSEENAIAVKMEGYDEINNEEFLDKTIEAYKAKKAEKLVIGYWPEPFEETSGILDKMIENKELFSNLKSLYVGDMDYEDCEISWIIQEDYSKFLDEFKDLEHLGVRGEQNLEFSNLNHSNLKSLELVTGGLPKKVIHSIADGNLPSLEKLVLYIGTEDYGFDGDITDIKYLMDNLKKFPKLKTLGLVNSEIQDEIVKLVVNHENIKELEVLDLSYGTLTDISAKIIIDNKDKLSHLKMLVIKRSFISEKYFKELSDMGIKVDLDDYQNVEIDWDKELKDVESISDIYYDNDIYPLYTE